MLITVQGEWKCFLSENLNDVQARPEQEKASGPPEKAP